VIRPIVYALMILGVASGCKTGAKAPSFNFWRAPSEPVTHDYSQSAVPPGPDNWRQPGPFPQEQYSQPPAYNGSINGLQAPLIPEPTPTEVPPALFPSN